MSDKTLTDEALAEMRQRHERYAFNQPASLSHAFNMAHKDRADLLAHIATASPKAVVGDADDDPGGWNEREKFLETFQAPSTPPMVTTRDERKAILWDVLKGYRRTIGEEALPMIIQDLLDCALFTKSKES